MRHNSLPKAFCTSAAFQALQALLRTRVFPGSAGTSALCSFFMHCRHFCALQFFQALQALLPLASCLQRYNKEAIIAHHWLDRILPDAALILASSLFPMVLRYTASASIVFPMDLRHSASASRHPAKAPWLVSSAAAPVPAAPPQRLSRPATNLIRRRKVLRFG